MKLIYLPSKDLTVLRHLFRIVNLKNKLSSAFLVVSDAYTKEESFAKNLLAESDCFLMEQNLT